MIFDRPLMTGRLFQKTAFREYIHGTGPKVCACSITPTRQRATIFSPNWLWN